MPAFRSGCSSPARSSTRQRSFAPRTRSSRTSAAPSSRRSSRGCRGLPEHAFRDWFLSAEERGNDGTRIDGRKPPGAAWTEGNSVEPLIDGAAYFRRLLDVLRSLRPGDWVHFTDWRGDWDERLDGPGTQIGSVLGDAAKRGAEIRGLIWRSH